MGSAGPSSADITIIEFEVSKFAEVILKVSAALTFGVNVNISSKNKNNILINFFILNNPVTYLYNISSAYFFQICNES